MNKLMMIIASVLIAVPIVAMELTHRKMELKISQQENDDFVLHVLKAVKFNKRMVEEGKINEHNAIHVILNDVSKDLAIHNALIGMLQSKKYGAVSSYIFAYEDCAQDYLNPRASGPIERGCKRPSLIEARQLCAELGLQSICPQYKKMCYRGAVISMGKKVCPHHFDKWAGGKIGDITIENVMTSGGKVTYDEYLLQQDRVDFMVANADFLSVDDENEKKTRIEKYIANILYQEIFAKQVD